MNHAVLQVSDVERSHQFWAEALGMVEAGRMPGVVFLRLPDSGNHHDLGLFAATSPAPPPGSVGLFHLAFEVESFDDLVNARKHLSNLGALAGESDHGTSLSLYAKDPDGIEFEVMWQLPRDAWDGGDPVTLPLDWQAAAQRWSS
ncbi:MAG: VOC family protein [Microthrixaceae bacterium]